MEHRLRDAIGNVLCAVAGEVDLKGNNYGLTVFLKAHPSSLGENPSQATLSAHLQ